MVEVRIGTSGWSYDHWDGVLYRPGLPTRDRLDAYCAEFDTVELNASYYRWPREASFAPWRRRLPPGFLMTVKAPRGLTHARRLYAPELWTSRIAAGMHALGERGRPDPAVDLAGLLGARLRQQRRRRQRGAQCPHPEVDAGDVSGGAVPAVPWSRRADRTGRPERR